MDEHLSEGSTRGDQDLTADWKIEIWDEETWTEDGGRRAVVELVHRATTVTLTAYACQFEDDPRVVIEVLRDDLSLSPVVASRLVGKLFGHFALDLHQDDGSVGFGMFVNLADVIEHMYDPDAGAGLIAMLLAGVRDPDVSVARHRRVPPFGGPRPIQ
jgi:hypothetical protein